MRDLLKKAWIPLVSLVPLVLLDASPGAAGAEGKTPLMLVSTGECRVVLAVSQTQGAEGCWIDERVTRNPGILTYPCSGGEAVARFGQTTFNGTVSAQGAVQLTVRTRFHYGDGCDWATVQSIAGDLGQRRLSYTYEEAPVAGQQGCAHACRATAPVTVTQDRAASAAGAAPTAP